WSKLVEIPGDGNSNGLGRAVASIQDTDGDGRPDVLVGLDDSNRARVYSSADGTVLLQVDGPPGAKLGRSIADVGDVNGDGHDDFALGGPEFDTFGLPTAGDNAGLLEVCSGVDGSLLFLVPGPTGSDQMGTKVAAGGDVDGDGAPD